MTGQPTPTDFNQASTIKRDTGLLGLRGEALPMLLKTTLFLTLLLVTITLVVHFVGQASWRSSIQLLQAELTPGAVAPKVRAYSIQELEGLPEPVQRYF